MVSGILFLSGCGNKIKKQMENAKKLYENKEYSKANEEISKISSEYSNYNIKNDIDNLKDKLNKKIEQKKAEEKNIRTSSLKLIF